jgi:hypothetical protein
MSQPGGSGHILRHRQKQPLFFRSATNQSREALAAGIRPERELGGGLLISPGVEPRQ